MKCDLSLIAMLRVLLKNAHENKGSERFIITDSASFVGAEVKELLSHILTKKDLTIYLAGHCVEVFKQSWETVCCCFDTRCIYYK